MTATTSAPFVPSNPFLAAVDRAAEKTRWAERECDARAMHAARIASGGQHPVPHATDNAAPARASEPDFDAMSSGALRQYLNSYDEEYHNIPGRDGLILLARKVHERAAASTASVWTAAVAGPKSARATAIALAEDADLQSGAAQERAHHSVGAMPRLRRSISQPVSAGSLDLFAQYTQRVAAEENGHRSNSSAAARRTAAAARTPLMLSERTSSAPQLLPPPNDGTGTTASGASVEIAPTHALAGEDVIDFTAMGFGGTGGCEAAGSSELWGVGAGGALGHAERPQSAPTGLREVVPPQHGPVDFDSDDDFDDGCGGGSGVGDVVSANGNGGSGAVNQVDVDAALADLWG
jgi:hypothetical protein